ncbi:MAG: hypothetical protein WC205_20215 [Opitutaceae bacterium]|jgi:hypothetical protein
MDNNEAKLLLAAYRHNGADANDPDFAAALRQAELDPALARDFADQRAFDARMSQALHDIPVPVEGKDYVAMSMKLSASRHRYWWWSAGLAACLVLVFTVATMKRGGVLDLPKDASLTALATHLSEHEASIGLMSADYGQLTAWLQQRGGPVPADLPAALLRLRAIGCQTWETSRGKVSLVCFMGGDQKTVHLYVFDDPKAFGDLPGLAHPKFDQSGKWSLAQWKDDQHAYVLGMPDEHDPEAALSRLFKS